MPSFPVLLLLKSACNLSEINKKREVLSDSEWDIMIVSAHPYEVTLCCAGVINQTLSAGEHLRRAGEHLRRE